MNPFVNNRGYGFQRPSFGDVLKSFFGRKTMLNYLIVSNIAVWLLVALVNVACWLFKWEGVNVVVNWLSLPASLDALSTRPWSVLTYMFLHEGFWHLFFNLWMLYFGGMLFVNLLTERQLLWTYVVGGVVGGLFFLLAYNVFPVLKDVRVGSYVLGASASSLAILVAAAAYRPDYELSLFLFGRLKFKWLAVIFVLVDVLGIGSDNAGGHIAHLGGAAYGFFCGMLMRKGLKVVNVNRSKKHKANFEYVSYEEVGEKPCPRSDEDYNQQKTQREHDIDLILDKVAKNGYSSLSEEEKIFLFKNSK